MNLFLLAAGEGTRFRPQTLKIPKPAIPLLNVPLAFYSLALADSLDLLATSSRLVINTYHLPQKIEALFSSENLSRCHWTLPVSFSHEGEKIRGSGGGLAFAREKLNLHHDTLLVNADEPIVPKNSQILQDVYLQHLSEGNLATLVCMKHPEAGKKFGAIWVDRYSHAIGFGKVTPREGLIPLHYLGAMFLSPKIFRYLKFDGTEANIIYDVLVQALKADERVVARSIDCEWHETGNAADFLMATKSYLQLLEHNKYLQNLISKYSLSGDQDLLRTERALVLRPKDHHPTSSLDGIEGFAVLGPEAKSFSKIKNSVVLTSTDMDLIEDQVLV